MATDPAVQAWITKHSSDIYETDLWFVVKEGGKEIRVPACRAVLKLTCALVRDLPEAGDVPVLGAHTADTVVKVVQACYPFGSEDFLEGENLQGLVAITNFAHWCGAQKITDRLLAKMHLFVRVLPRTVNGRGPPAKATYEAVFSMLDVTGKWGAKSLFDAVWSQEDYWRVSKQEDYLVGMWPSFFLDLPEAERAPFERHSKRMFRYFLEFNKQKWSALVKDRLGTLPIMDPIFSAMNDMHRAMEYLTNPA